MAYASAQHVRIVPHMLPAGGLYPREKQLEWWLGFRDLNLGFLPGVVKVVRPVKSVTKDKM